LGSIISFVGILCFLYVIYEALLADYAVKENAFVTRGNRWFKAVLEKKLGAYNV